MSISLFLTTKHYKIFTTLLYRQAVLHKTSSVLTISFYDPHEKVQESTEFRWWRVLFYIFIVHSETLTFKLTMEEPDNFHPMQLNV